MRSVSFLMRPWTLKKPLTYPIRLIFAGIRCQHLLIEVMDRSLKIFNTGLSKTPCARMMMTLNRFTGDSL